MVMARVMTLDRGLLESQRERVVSVIYWDLVACCAPPCTFVELVAQLEEFCHCHFEYLHVLSSHRPDTQDEQPKRMKFFPLLNIDPRFGQTPKRKRNVPKYTKLNIMLEICDVLL